MNFASCVGKLGHPFELNTLIEQVLIDRKNALKIDDAKEVASTSEFYLMWKAECIASVLYDSEPEAIRRIMSNIHATFDRYTIGEVQVGTTAIKELQSLRSTIEVDEQQRDCLEELESMMPPDFSMPKTKIKLSNKPAVLSLALCRFAQVPSINDKDFFKQLVQSAKESWRTDDYSNVGSAKSGFPAYRRQINDAFVSTLTEIPPKAEKNILVYDENDPPEERVAKTAFYQNKLDSELTDYMRYHLPILREGLSVIYISDIDLRDEDPTKTVKATYVAEAQMLYLQRLGSMPVSTPNHAMYAQVYGDTVKLMDPNTQSLQGLEGNYDIKLRQNGNPTFQRKCKHPGGWCQTFAWFHQECKLSRRLSIHDELLRWFEINRNFDIEVAETAPDSVKAMITACNTPGGATEVLKHRDALCRFVELMASRYIQMHDNIVEKCNLGFNMWFYELWKATREVESSFEESSKITLDESSYVGEPPITLTYRGAERRLTALYRAVKTSSWVETFLATSAFVDLAV